MSLDLETLDLETDFEDLEGDPFLGSLPWGQIARTAVSALGGLLGEEGETDFENGETDFEDFEASDFEDQEQIEMLADMAARTESEAEADGFIGALIPLAAKALPLAAKFLPKALSIGKAVLPNLIRGGVRVARRLHRSPATRPLVRAVPTIIRRTAQTVGKQLVAGKPVTPRTATRVLAGQAMRVLSSPQQASAAVRRCQLAARRSYALCRRRLAAQARVA